MAKGLTATQILPFSWVLLDFLFAHNGLQNKIILDHHLQQRLGTTQSLVHQKSAVSGFQEDVATQKSSEQQCCDVGSTLEFNMSEIMQAN